MHYWWRDIRSFHTITWLCREKKMAKIRNRITELQNGWGWKGPLKFIKSKHHFPLTMPPSNYRKDLKKNKQKECYQIIITRHYLPKKSNKILIQNKLSTMGLAYYFNFHSNRFDKKAFWVVKLRNDYLKC